MSEAENFYNLTSSLLKGEEKGYDPEDLEAGYYGSGSSFQTLNNYSPISTSSHSFKTIENNIEGDGDQLEGDGDQLENAEQNVQDFVEENANSEHHVIDMPPNVSTSQIAREYASDALDRATTLPQMGVTATGIFFGVMHTLKHFFPPA